MVGFWANGDLIHLLIAGRRVNIVRSHLSVNDLARLGGGILAGRRVGIRIEPARAPFCIDVHGHTVTTSLRSPATRAFAASAVARPVSGSS